MMPISKEKKGRYPANWHEIRYHALNRARQKCQHPGCDAREYDIGYWEILESGGKRWFRVYGGFASWKEARERLQRIKSDLLRLGRKPIVIVLTIAHLDHQPENNDPQNLMVMCQRHHLQHDAEEHRRNARATRRRQRETTDMFEEVA